MDLSPISLEGYPELHAMQPSHSLLLFACSRLSVVEKVMLPRGTDVIEILRFFLLHSAISRIVAASFL